MLLCLASVLLSINEIKGQEKYTNEGNQLTSVPADIPNDVQILELRKNKIAQLVESDFDRLGSLEEIYLTSNVIERVQEKFVNPSIHTNLSVLSLEDNLIEIIPKLNGLESLKYLHLSQNKLREVHFGQLDALQEIFIDKNNLTSMPNLTKELSSLTKLYLYKNNIAELPVGYFAKLPALKELNLRSNLFVEITIGRLDSLETLTIEDNKLTAMPMFTHSMPALEIMRLSKNPITNISADYFDRISLLKELEMNEVHITTFDCSCLHHLQKLYLDQTWLSSFPNITECFSSLVQFSVQRTQGRISTSGIDKALVFGSSLQQKVSTSLTHIDLRNSYIQHVPAWFLHAVPRLVLLDIASTKLTEMPDINANYKYVC